ncbi:MAG: hypothetical protein HY927_12505 [Elusimicrobia bacterium]|nr:hypothetical protein [Elusimicrobiota bacterium]
MTPWRLFWAALALAWALLHPGALAYLYHRPSALTAGVLWGAAMVAWRLLAAAALWCAAKGIGGLLLGRLELRGASEGERVVVESAVGLGALSYGLFAMGLAGLWTSWPLAIAAALCLWPARAGLRSLVRAVSIPGPGGWLGALLALPIALAALQALFIANAPPADWDSLAVHLEVPRIYARAGAMVPVTWMLHGTNAMAAELLYVPALVWGDARLAQMVMVLFQALMAGAVWTAGRSLCGEGAKPAAAWALAAAAVFLADPAVSDMAGTTGTDFAVGLFGMLSFWSAWRFHGNGERSWLWVSGAMAGLACASKLSGLMLAAALAPLVFAAGCRHGKPWRVILAWGAGTLAFCAPWYLRAAILTGNPVWPHFGGFFAPDSRTLWLAARAHAGVAAGMGAGWTDLLLLPVRLMLHPDAFQGEPRALLVALALLAAFQARRIGKDGFAVWVMCYALLYGVCWFKVQQLWRYLIPVIPWLALLASRWAWTLWCAGDRGRWRAAALALALLPAMRLAANNEVFPVLGLRPSEPGVSPETAYLRRRLDCYEAMEYVNANLPKQARVLLYREIRGYYLERAYVIGDPQSELLLGYETVHSAEELDRRLRALGVSHVLVNPRRVTFSSRVEEFWRVDRLMKEALLRFAEPPVETGGLLLYTLR